MLKKILHIAILICLIQPAFAQRADVWVFWFHSGLDFKETPVKLIQPFFQWSYDRPYNVPYGSSVTDCQGGLLLYTSNIQVYNRLQKPMKNGVLLDDLNISLPNISGIISYQNCVVIIPNPSDSFKYYIVSSIPYPGYNTLAFKGVYYSVVDMRLDNGLGAVDSNKKDIRIDSFATSCLAVAPHINNKNLWLVTKPTPDSFYAYLVTDSMISNKPVRSYGLGGVEAGIIKFSHDYSQIASTYITQAQSKYSAFIYNFNRSTGKISNAKPILKQNQHLGELTQAIEFSPNDSLIYISTPHEPTPWVGKNNVLFQVENFVTDMPITAGYFGVSVPPISV